MVLLDSIWTNIKGAWGYSTSSTIAVCRLLFLTAAFLFSALQYIFFSRVEIVKINMACLPFRCDREDAMDKMSYIDKLCCENPELVQFSDDEDSEDGGGLDNSEEN